MLFVPLGLTRMSTISSWPISNGIDLSKTIGGGTKCWFCPCKHDGSQASLCKIAVVRLHITLEMTHHLYGHGFPLKVSWRFMKASSKLGIWVTIFVAVSQFKWHWQYADLKLSFFSNILQPGYFNLPATVHLINLLRHFLNCMVVVKCRQFASLQLFPNNPTSSSDCVSIDLLWWSCRVCWLSTMLGYLTGPCICLEFKSTYAMATGSRICKWCHPRLTLEATLVVFLRLCDFQFLLLLEGLLLVLNLWWVWAAIVIHGAEYFSYKAKGNDCQAMVQGFLAFWIQNRILLVILLVLLLLFWDWINDFLGPWVFFSVASVVISKQNKGFLGLGFCCSMISFMMSNMLCENVIMSLIARDSKSSCVGGAVVLLVSRSDSESIWYSGAGLIILTLSQSQTLLIGGAVVLLVLRGLTKRTLCGIVLFKLNPFLVMFLCVPSIDSMCFPHT